MKNILTILKELGIEVPADKEAGLNSAVAENYKPVADYDKQKEKLYIIFVMNSQSGIRI